MISKYYIRVVSVPGEGRWLLILMLRTIAERTKNIRESYINRYERRTMTDTNTTIDLDEILQLLAVHY